MTKRRSIVALFLAVAILAIGVGYAAVADTLSVGGILEASQSGAQSQFDVDVTFLDALTPLPNGCTVTLSDDKDRATISIKNSTDLAHKDDAVSVVIPVQNLSVYDATLAINDKGVDDSFTVTYALYSDAGCSAALTPSEIAAGGTVYLKVDVKVTADPTAATLTTTLDMEMTATTK